MGSKKFVPEKNVPRLVYGPPPWFEDDEKKDGDINALSEASHTCADTIDNTNGDKKDE